MKKVFAYIDGFNLYHNLKSYISFNNLSPTLKWLNVRKLLEYFIDSKLQTLDKITFFSAVPNHYSISKQEKHKNYYDVLRSENVNIVSGRFSKKVVSHFKCKVCGSVNTISNCSHCYSKDTSKFITYEEKETDVSLAINIISDVLTVDDLDKVILLSSDTDFLPVVRYILENTNKKVTVLFPLGCKHSNEFFSIKNSDGHFFKKYSRRDISLSQVESSLFPDEVHFDGNIYRNPYI